jgi:hypothetical protein
MKLLLLLFLPLLVIAELDPTHGKEPYYYK